MNLDSILQVDSNLLYYLIVTVFFVLMGIMILSFFNRIQLNFPKWKGGQGKGILGIRLAKIISLLIVAIFYMDAVGIDVTSLLAFGGIGAFAFSFAAQDVIKNIFGFILLEFERPFKIGDEVKIHKLGVEGTVENISWRMSKIRTQDGYLTMVPNAAFVTEVVVNKSLK